MSIKYRNSNGQETIISGLTPGGDIEAGAVATRSGKVDVSPLEVGAYQVTNVTFDTPMPDDTYIINIDCTSGKLNIATFGKTANGFSIVYLNSSNLVQPQGDSIDWTATKTYTVQHAAQNAEDIAALKQATPAGAGPSNKFATANDITRVEDKVEDISDAISNPNLLDNPWFTINQREFSTLSTSGYSYDRWQMVIDIGTINATSDGVELDATSNAITFCQKREMDPKMWDGKTSYTWSMDYTVIAKPSNNNGITIFSNGNTTIGGHLTNVKVVRPSEVTTGQRYMMIGTKTLPSESDTTKPCALVWLYIQAGWKIKIHSIKVEKGTVSTLANDIEPNYQQELAKCQRYYYELNNNDGWCPMGHGHFRTDSIAEVLFRHPVEMRTNPTITLSNINGVTMSYPSTEGTDIQPTSMTINLSTKREASLLFNTINVATLNSCTEVWLKTDPSAKLTFSADL